MSIWITVIFFHNTVLFVSISLMGPAPGNKDMWLDPLRTKFCGQSIQFFHQLTFKILMEKGNYPGGKIYVPGTLW